MVDINLKNIDYSKYELLGKRLIDQTLAMLILDTEGGIIWSSDSFSAVAQEQLQADYSLPNNTKDGSVCFRLEMADNTDIECLQYSLLDEDNKIFGYMLLGLENLDWSTLMHSNIEALSQCIHDEWKIMDELNSMTVELTDRYEELNLVYNSRDEISQFSETQSALKALVINCQDHMSVNFAVLMLPEKNITLLEATPNAEDSELTSMLDKIRLSMYPWLCENQRTMVINSLGDPLLQELSPGIFFKIICCPILDGSGEVCGVLSVMNHYNHPDFSNSDRNLVEVIGRKATKIIQSAYDRLTGLLTRSSFESALSELLENSSAKVIDQSLMLIRLEDLGIINDMHGLSAGDSIIKSVAKLVETELRTEDIVARMAGNVLAVILDRCTENNSVLVAEKLQKKINLLPFHFGDENLSLKSSLGIVAIKPSATTQTLLTSAELVMDMAKQKGRNRIEVFRQDDKEVIDRKSQIRWVNKIQEAISNNEFSLFCQGIYSINELERAHHYEILLRLEDKAGKFVSPGEFLPAAEHYRLMPSIDRWVLKTTIKMLQASNPPTDMSWAINLSGQTVSDPQFREFVIEAIGNATFNPQCLGFEITETTAINNINAARQLIDAIKGFGCKVYLDDFGTGLSSFSYLQSLPFDYVKIDGCFVRKIDQDPVSAAMVSATCDVARAMDLKSIAEFVEHKDMIPRLRELGVDYLQGYCLHKPEALTEILNSTVSKATYPPPQQLMS